MKVKRTTEVSEEVSDRLIESIVTWKLKPGHPLREARLAKEWGVSRTPVREAVRQAAALGLVELRPNRAPLVRLLSLKDAMDLYSLREVLEVLALELAFEAIPEEKVEALCARIENLEPGLEKVASRRAAHNVDADLHQLWIAHCGNRWLQQTIDQLWTFIEILQQIVAKDETALRNSIDEHQAVLAALRLKDLTATRKALLHHLRSSAKYLRQRLATLQAGDNGDNGA
ncbi:MAG: GntR family transcriptional regulator [Opitutaceae bacterium]